MLGFAVNVSRSFQIGPNDTQIGVLKFSSEIDVGFYLDEYHTITDVVEAIEQLEIEGGDTNIAGALHRTRYEMFSPTHGARFGVSKVLFLVTDGTPNIDALLTVPEAKATKDSGIEIFAIGVTSMVHLDILQSVASEPKDSHVYFVETFDQLATIVQTLVNVSCGTMPRSAISTTPTTTTTTQFRTTTTTTTTTTTPAPSTTPPPREFACIVKAGFKHE